jgi:hypothetical protein
LPIGDIDRSFCGAIEVVQFCLQPLKEPLLQAIGQRLTAADYPFQRGALEEPGYSENGDGTYAFGPGCGARGDGRRDSVPCL